MDCLEGMKQIPDGSIDAIICDLPYGTMKTLSIGAGWKSEHPDWDETIPTAPLFEQYERVLRTNGVAILFSQEPYTSHLRTFNAPNMEFCYPLYWLKDHCGNIMLAKYAPLIYIEEMNVFVKKHDSQRLNPLRDYSRHVVEFIGMNSGQVADYFRKNNVQTPTRAQHFLSYEGVQYDICTEDTYNLLIEKFGIDKMDGFKTYKELQRLNARFERTFNLPEGKASKSNVLQYAKDTDGFHPTQKPVALIADLIRTYSNEGDTILDNCMGSGTTAVACIKEKRHFIGFELNKEYYDKACKRIDAAQRQLTLF